MQRQKLLLLHIVLLLSAWSVAGQVVVSGKVSDALTGLPLEMATVGIDGTALGTVTDAAGHYSLRLPPADSTVVRVSYTGYGSRRMVLLIHSDTIVNVALAPESHTLDEIEIVDENSRQTSFTHIDVQKLDDAVGPSAGVESLLKTLPDVGSNNELSSQYSVRGGSFDENLVYINGVEIFRPMLIRSGQQEGMSIINPDLVDFLLFSPGGFDASYGDKMSSVLDITYGRPQKDFVGRASASLLGASLAMQGKVGECWSYSGGLRWHNNRYLLSSLGTRGSYTTSYADLQALVNYRPSEKLNIGLLTVATSNVYGLVPESQTTAFGTLEQAMQLDIYFDGAEEDRYRTLLTALTFDFQANDDWHLRASLSEQHITESERYDVQSQYWLYEVTMGQEMGEVERFDRGVGTFLEHARNRLSTDILQLDLSATKAAALGSWQMGLRLQGEAVSDRLREWRLVDSAGYALPTTLPTPGDSNAQPSAPIVQQYVNSSGGLLTARGIAYIQRELNLSLRKSDLKMVAGLRGGFYASRLSHYSIAENTPLRHTLSPRLSLSIKPRTEADILFRIAMGIYQQAPFYREYRREDGSLNAAVSPQTSYQATSTFDWNMHILNRPFRLTADVYFKYIPDLIPYTVDNLRITYHPDQEAQAYAAGVSVRLNGEFVEGLESWASLSFMQARENIVSDGIGWRPRPTDQRFSFKLFLQDYIPNMPWWRMSMSFIFATGMPISAPQGAMSNPLRLPAYLRVDWGNTVQLSRFESLQGKGLLRWFDDVQVGVEVFNLFNFRNVVSYLWVADYDGASYRVPNYLTARQLNLKLTLIF